jgi:hypothetical protein
MISLSAPVPLFRELEIFAILIRLVEKLAGGFFSRSVLIL